MHFSGQMENLALAVIINNIESVEDQSNSLQEECYKELQRLTEVLENTGSVVFNFNSLSSKPLLQLFTGVNQVAATRPLNAFVLIILSKGKTVKIYCHNDETLQTIDILSCFSNVKCPKLFFFQTILTNPVHLPTDINESCSLSNSVVFSAYPSQNESSQVPIFIECIQALCNNRVIGDVVDETKKKIERNHYPIHYQRSQDLQNGMTLAIQSPNYK